MRTSISQRTKKTNEKAFEVYFKANEKVKLNLKRATAEEIEKDRCKQYDYVA